MIHSISEVGRCLDNAPLEGFFGILKLKKYHLRKYSNYEEQKNDIEDYINFYNNERLQKRLGRKSPNNYRKVIK